MKRISFVCLIITMVGLKESFSLQTWMLVSPAPTTSALRGVAWTGSCLVAVGDNGAVLTSVNASDWTVQQSGVSTTLRAVVWADSLLYAVGDQGTVLTSRNGTSWTPAVSGVTGDLYAIIRAENRFVVTGVATVLTSDNGAIWTKRNLGTLDTLTGVAWDGSRLVAGGCNSTILSSDSDTAWTQQTSGYLDWIYGIIFHNGQFVTVGYNLSAYNCYGTALTSPEGASWSRTFSGTTKQALFAVTAVDSQYVAVGYNGTIMTSTDAATWAPCSTGTTRRLFAVTATPSLFVAVGDRGTILYSPRSPSNAVKPGNDVFFPGNPPAIYNLKMSQNGISFSWNLPAAGMMKIGVANLSGRVVFSILNSVAASGRRELALNGVSSGTYLLNISGEGIAVGRTITIR